jgi:hypothetical protein
MKVVRLTESDLARIVERVLNEQVQEVTNFDKDYDYKKEGDNYFFKLKVSPVSEKAKGFKSQGKFLNWTKATGTGLEAIKTKVFKEVTTQTTSTTPKPSSTETTTPEVKQAEKTSVDSLAEPKLASTLQTGQVQRQSQIPPVAPNQVKKTERKVQTQTAAGQIPTDYF